MVSPLPWGSGENYMDYIIMKYSDSSWDTAESNMHTGQETGISLLLQLKEQSGNNLFFSVFGTHLLWA